MLPRLHCNLEQIHLSFLLSTAVPIGGPWNKETVPGQDLPFIHSFSHLFIQRAVIELLQSPSCCIRCSDFREEADLGSALLLLLISWGKELQTVRMQVWGNRGLEEKGGASNPCPSTGAGTSFPSSGDWDRPCQSLRPAMEERLFLFLSHEPLRSCKLRWARA